MRLNLRAAWRTLGDGLSGLLRLVRPNAGRGTGRTTRVVPAKSSSVPDVAYDRLDYGQRIEIYDVPDVILGIASGMKAEAEK